MGIDAAEALARALDDRGWHERRLQAALWKLCDGRLQQAHSLREPSHSQLADETLPPFEPESLPRFEPEVVCTNEGGGSGRRYPDGTQGRFELADSIAGSLSQERTDARLYEGAHAKGWRVFERDGKGHFWYRITTYCFTSRTEALLFDQTGEVPVVASGAERLRGPPLKQSDQEDAIESRHRSSGRTKRMRMRYDEDEAAADEPAESAWTHAEMEAVQLVLLAVGHSRAPAVITKGLVEEAARRAAAGRAAESEDEGEDKCEDEGEGEHKGEDTGEDQGEDEGDTKPSVADEDDATLRADLPTLRADLPALRADLPTLRADLPDEVAGATASSSEGAVLAPAPATAAAARGSEAAADDGQAAGKLAAALSCLAARRDKLRAVRRACDVIKLGWLRHAPHATRGTLLPPSLHTVYPYIIRREWEAGAAKGCTADGNVHKGEAHKDMAGGVAESVAEGKAQGRPRSPRCTADTAPVLPPGFAERRATAVDRGSPRDEEAAEAQVAGRAAREEGTAPVHVKVQKSDEGLERLSQQPPQGADPEETGDALVGQRIKVHWPLDEAWYVAVVTGYSHETKQHEVRYVDDDVVEALDPEGL
jgi:hypothetical protein